MPVASESQAPASDRTAVLAARGLTKVYGSGEVEVRALRGVDLDLYEAELVVLLGPSGSGKSTLLNIIGGLDRPSSRASRSSGSTSTSISPSRRNAGAGSATASRSTRASCSGRAPRR
jgi:putative ABC transport system ATP-binding protein